jgi:ABC-2 type transport system permease protein
VQTLLQSLRRDFRMEFAYKMKCATDICYVIFAVLLYHFLSKMISGKANAYLAKYQCDYFSFVMVGIATANVLQAGLQNFSENMRKFMAEGSLEAMFASPTPHYKLILYSSVWPFLYAIFKTALQFLVAWLAFGFALKNINVFSTLLSTVLSLALFLALVVISSSALIILKRGDPVNWLVIQLAHIFGGILFPVQLLPGWAQTIAWLFPIRSALETMRSAMLIGAPVAAMKQDLCILAGFTIVLGALSVITCTLFVNASRRSGAFALF